MHDPRSRGFVRPRPVATAVALIMAILALAVVAPAPSASAASSPGGAVAAAWPASWNAYLYNDGTTVRDNNTDQNPSTLDLASGTCVGNCVGPLSSVQYASDGTTAFFRMRLATNIADNTKGGLVGGAFLTLLAVGGVVKAVVGVDGKSSSVDSVYVADSIGGTVSTVYTYPFDNTGGQTSAGMRVVAAGDGSGQYFLDYQVPLSVITTISGNTITSSTAIQLYYGSSAAANLAIINKDFMTGDVSAVDFSNLSTVSLSPAALSVSSAAVIASGSNPPTQGSTSSYTVTVTASNPGGGPLTNATVTIPVPASVTATSPTTAAGTISGSPLVWTIGTLLPGQSVTATFTASVTPTAGDVGATYVLVSAQPGSGTDAPLSATRTATGAPIVLGVVAPATYTVAFNSAGGSAVSSQSVTSGNTATSPTAPTRAGYTFNGWFTAAVGGSAWNFATAITGNTTLYAQWTAITYTVTFDSTGGSAVSSQTVASGSPATSPTAPTRAGYTFGGWFTAAVGGSAWNFATAITSDTTLYAHWAPVTYTVSFNTGGGNAVGSQTVTSGTPAGDPGTPTRAGFTFDGWFTAAVGGSAWNFSTAITGDTTIYAQWTAVPPVTYIVAFDSAGGSAVSSQTVASGSAATTPTAPTRAGYTFNGWFTAAVGGSAWDFSTAITGDTTIYAQWTAVPPGSFTVTFDSTGGTVVADQVVVGGATASSPTNPTRAGYTFNGWFTAASGGSAWNFATAINGDTTLYAQWTIVPPVMLTLHFDGTGGTSASDQSVATGGTGTAPADPTRAGYTFVGWFTAAVGGTVWNFTTDTITVDTTLYAHWTAAAPILWTVSFDSVGGSVVASQSVADGASATVPTSAIKAGYSFLGWFTAPSGGAAWNFSTAISAGVTLYAHWSAVGSVSGGTVSGLATTGSALAPVLMFALLMIALGLAMVAGSRRREEA